MAASGYRAAGQTAGKPQSAFARHATLDGALIERALLWWRRLSPRGQRGWLGSALVLLAVIGGWNLVATSSAHSTHPARHVTTALMAQGSWLTALFGLGAFPTLGIVGILGALWLAEGAARRSFMGRWLTFALLALWLGLQVGVGLALPGQGGVASMLLAAPLMLAPGGVRGCALFLIALLVMGLALTIGGALAHIVAGGLVATPRVILRILHRFPDWLRGEGRSIALAPQPGAAHTTFSGSLRHDPQGQSRHPFTHPQGALTQQTSREQIHRLTREIEHALNDHGAIVEVYPLAPHGRIIRLRIQSVGRLKRDARGQIMANEQGRPIMVRTRISKILRLRETLAQELGVRDLRMILPDEDAQLDAKLSDSPSVIFEIAR